MILFISRFEDAPSVLQKLSTNGGDEDWIIYAAHEDGNYIAECVAEGLMVCEVDKYPHPEKEGIIVYITCHA